MKYLETNSIEKLLTIIPESPATRVMHISDGGDPLYVHLKAFCLSKEYEYLLATLNDDFYTSKKEESSREDLHFVKKITLEQRGYASLSKQYDFLFVSAKIPVDFENEFVKKVHGHIKSSGNIILFLPKHDSTVIRRWYEHLEEHLYVAMNTLDIFEHYELLIAKKMHGWGGK